MYDPVRGHSPAEPVPGTDGFKPEDRVYWRARSP